MFFGKNKVMMVALGRSPADEYKDNLHQVNFWPVAGSVRARPDLQLGSPLNPGLRIAPLPHQLLTTKNISRFCQMSNETGLTLFCSVGQQEVEG